MGKSAFSELENERIFSYIRHARKSHSWANFVHNLADAGNGKRPFEMMLLSFERLREVLEVFEKKKTES